MTLKQVAARTGLPAATIRAGVTDGTFPRPLPLGPWDTGWPEAAVRRWMRANNVEEARNKS